LTPELAKAFEDTEIVALDVEGVDLGRNGIISLVQLAVSPNKCFLLDLLNKTKDDPLVNWLRVILESKDIVKIVHDCRMDADALRYHLEIELSNVHDTSCWHYTITGSEWDGLNKVLSVNGIKENANHDNSVYIKDHAFWATRPLTAQMIERAVGDVTRMFELRASQTSKSSPKIDMEAKALSDAYLNAARTANVEYVVVGNSSKDVPAPKFNIFALRKWTNSLIYPCGDRTKGIYIVYYHHKWALNRIRRAARLTG
jgi:DNA polymerase I-like protein with 3'-5' exonuclease and polymerase domains